MGRSRPRNPLIGMLGGLTFTLVGCGGSTREVAIQNAKAGDLLVEAGGSRVELIRPFQTGVANGQYRGVVKVSSASDGGATQMHEMNAVCSIKGEPGWPTYDNIYGYPITHLDDKSTFSDKKRWQVLYHFDGRIEKSGTLQPDGWASRLKDNLCRKGDFDDTGKAP
jgi:hypothetical protein